jgi:uncharacterized protein YndB with AHSA1/START domain
MAEPRNQVHLTAEVSAPPERVFDYLTDHFDEMWMGSMQTEKQGSDPAAPKGLGFVRRMRTPAGELLEEIVTHDKPSLIEYRVINPEARFQNHLGRIQLSERPKGGTRVDYRIGFDYRPSWQGPLTAAAMRAGWAVQGRRRLAKLD